MSSWESVGVVDQKMEEPSLDLWKVKDEDQKIKKNINLIKKIDGPMKNEDQT